MVISIIIVGYNSRRYLSGCFNSLKNSTVKNFQIIFVDNNSSDGSVEYIREKFPETEVVDSKENLGFAGGNNLGIKEALKLKSEYIMLLNPDTVIEKHCLEILLERANQNTVLQPLILLHLNGKKTNLINTTGNYINFLGLSYCNDYKKPASFAKEREIATASGAACLIPSSLFEKIGIFDKNFFMYHEDVDFFWRARKVGFKIRLVPRAEVWHNYRFSKGKQKFFYIERNRLFFLFKNFSIKYLFLILPAMIINEILMIAYSIIGGWFSLKIKSYLSFFTYINAELQARRSIKTAVQLNEGKLKEFLEAKVSFSELDNPLFSIYNVFLKSYWALIYKII